MPGLGMTLYYGLLGMYLEIYLEYTYLSTKNKRVYLLLNDCPKIRYICKSTPAKHN